MLSRTASTSSIVENPASASRSSTCETNSSGTDAPLVTLHLDHVAASPGLVLADIFLTLSTAAPWLFGGLAGALLIATVRGLPQCVRDLRAHLAGRIMAEEPPARPGSWAPDGVRRAPDGVRRRMS